MHYRRIKEHALSIFGGWGWKKRFTDRIFRVVCTVGGWNTVLVVGQLALAPGTISIVHTASALRGQAHRAISWRCSKNISTRGHGRPALAGPWPCSLYKLGLGWGKVAPRATLYSIHQQYMLPTLCIIHFKDTINKSLFSTSPTKYRRCMFLDSSTVY
jgi:hypothetical protein